MPPLALPRGEKTCSGADGWQQAQARDGGVAAVGVVPRARGGAVEQRLLLKQSPKTQPDLLAGMRGASSRSGSPDGGAGIWRTPSKVLVSVSVQRSMWPLHVMASAEWRVADLVAAAVGLYVKECRRPLLSSADPAAFGLHYSQFSLEGTFPGSSRISISDFALIDCQERPGHVSTQKKLELIRLSKQFYPNSSMDNVRAQAVRTVNHLASTSERQ
jgi:hypothetical protein